MIKLNHSNIIIPNILKEHTVNYPTPITINYFFGFGFTSGVFLGIQIFSGIFLAMFYVPDVNNAFESVEMIVNEIHYGWFFRNVHQTGASFFFMAVYIHIARSIYFKSFYWPNTCVWWSGLVIFLLMVATAFLGYVLPWSQMGFWAATVITNLFTAIPIVGNKVVLWIWGGYSVQNNTLKRFAILHYILPFVLTGLMGLHLSLLHKSGSSDSLLSLKFTEKLNFYPFFIKKDLSFISIILLAFMVVVCLYPTLFSEVDIYNKADPLTGIYVIPEWYFLPIFGFVKCVRSKILGIFLILSFFLVLALCPLFVNFEGRYMNSNDQTLYNFVVLNIFASYISLGWVAAQPLTEEIFVLNQIGATWFFTSFLLLCITENYRKA